MKLKSFQGRVVTPLFKEYHKGTLKIISFYAKKARGLMARYIIDNQINDADQLKKFDCEGYIYNALLSSKNGWIFTRQQ